MPYEFPDDKYQEVRSVIGVEVTESMLPDDVLSLDTFEGEAERFIMRYLTQTQIDDPIYADQINTAAVYYLASLAVPILPTVTSERIPGGSLSYADVDRTAQALALKNQATGILNTIDTATGQPVIASNPNIFTKAPRKYW